MINNPVAVPTFDREVQYEELPPKSGKYKYRFSTLKEIEVFFLYPIIPKDCSIIFTDNGGIIWMKMTHDSIIISKDYAWDGCTPKKWWGIWWGTPDFKETILPSLVHDALIQFQETDHFPFSRLDIDNIFKNLLIRNKFLWAPIYYTGVRIGSKFEKLYDNISSELIIENIR